MRLFVLSRLAEPGTYIKRQGSIYSCLQPISDIIVVNDEKYKYPMNILGDDVIKSISMDTAKYKIITGTVNPRHKGLEFSFYTTPYVDTIAISAISITKQDEEDYEDVMIFTPRDLMCMNFGVGSEIECGKFRLLIDKIIEKEDECLFKTGVRLERF